MKFTKLFIAVSLLIAFVACNDDQSDLGFTVQPSDDLVQAKTVLYDVATTTLYLDSMFLKTDSAMLGTFTNAEFGMVRAEFLTQLNCPKNFSWNEKMLGRPDSVALKLYYSNFFGDSLATLNATVYELSEKLVNKKSTFYTNIDPEKYNTSGKILGQKAFTAVDLSIPDSVKSDADYDGPYVTIPLKEELINRFYGPGDEATSYDPKNFSSTENFLNFFKGIYVKTTLGDGTILYLDDVYMQFYFDYVEEDEDTAEKDTVVGAATFPSNKEVVLANRAIQPHLKGLLEQNATDTTTFIKTPIGALTTLKIPVKDIKEKIGTNFINTMKFEVSADYDRYQETYMNYQPPRRLLMVRKSELMSFFENGEVYDGKTSFIAQLNTSTYTYTFNNLSKLLENSEEDEEEMVLVPVVVTTDSSTGLVVKVKPQYAPTAAKLKNSKAKNRPTKLFIIYTEL